MLSVTRIKKTKQIVFPVGKADANHTLVLFPYNRTSKKGHRGCVQSVRNDNLVSDKELM